MNLRDVPVPPERLQQLRNTILSDLKPVKPLAPQWVFATLLALIFVGLVGIGGSLLGPVGWRVLSILQRTAIFTSLCASSSFLTFVMVRQMAPGNRFTVPPVWLPAAVLGLLALVTSGLFLYQPEPAFMKAGLVCLGIGLLFAIPASAAFWLVLRRGAWLAPQLSGAAAGLLAGLVGVTVLEIHCPILDVYHILLWHLGPAILATVGGVGAGWRALQRNRSPRP